MKSLYTSGLKACTALFVGIFWLSSATLFAQLTLSIDHPAYLNVHHGDTVAMQCSGIALMSVDNIVVTGNCNDDVAIDFKESVVIYPDVIDGLQSALSCSFTATDSCGRTGQLVVVLAIYDNEAPILQDVPSDIELPASAAVPEVAVVWAIDNCTRNIEVNFFESEQESAEALIINRHWSAIDEAGNLAEATQVIRMLASNSGSDDGGSTGSSPTAPRIDTNEITALIGITGTHCLNLTGDVKDYVINLKTVANRDILKVDDFESACIKFTGTKMGRAAFNFEYCAAGGNNCGTIYLIINIISRESVKPPTAYDDLFAVAYNGIRTLHVLGNDEIIGGVADMFIADHPRGQVRIDAHNRLQYTAPQDWCGDDSFSYEVCNTAGCVSANVKLQVTCEDLMIFNGFSPNKDGLNDAFTIIGIENYPNNDLVIFNAHGHEVYKAQGYNNTWEGTHQGSALMDGTYFFVLNIEGRSVESGYVQIKR